MENLSDLVRGIVPNHYPFFIRGRFPPSWHEHCQLYQNLSLDKMLFASYAEFWANFEQELLYKSLYLIWKRNIVLRLSVKGMEFIFLWCISDAVVHNVQQPAHKKVKKQKFAENCEVLEFAERVGFISSYNILPSYLTTSFFFQFQFKSIIFWNILCKENNTFERNKEKLKEQQLFVQMF